MLLPNLCEMTIMCKVEQMERRKGRKSSRAFLPKRFTLGLQEDYSMKKIIAALGICAAICALGVTACAETAETAESVEFTASAETASTAESETAAETADTADETASTTEGEDAAGSAETQSPATGVEGIALVAATAIAAGGIMLVASKKR